MRLKKYKIRGSLLPIVLIFSFVILVTVSAFAYNFRTDLTTIRLLLQEDEYAQANDANINELPDSDYTIGTQKIGDYTFVNTIISITPSFYGSKTNARLYNAQAHVLNYQIKHEVYHKSNKVSTEIVSINKLPKDSLLQYSGDAIPLNIPYVNTKAFSDDQKIQMLDDSGNMVNYFGNIGCI